jgi:hypothetical protein
MDGGLGLSSGGPEDDSRGCGERGFGELAAGGGAGDGSGELIEEATIHVGLRPAWRVRRRVRPRAWRRRQSIVSRHFTTRTGAISL